MKANPFTDKVLGDFHLDKKKSTKTHWCYKRETTMKLHKIHAQDFVDPATGKKQIVFGEVHLVQLKLVNKDDATFSMQNIVEKTPLTECENAII